MGGFVDNMPFLKVLGVKDKVGSAFKMIPDAVDEKKDVADTGDTTSVKKPQTKLKKLLE